MRKSVNVELARLLLACAVGVAGLTASREASAATTTYEAVFSNLSFSRAIGDTAYGALGLTSAPTKMTYRFTLETTPFLERTGLAVADGFADRAAYKLNSLIVTIGDQEYTALTSGQTGNFVQVVDGRRGDSLGDVVDSVNLFNSNALDLSNGIRIASFTFSLADPLGLALTNTSFPTAEMLNSDQFSSVSGGFSFNGVTSTGRNNNYDITSSTVSFREIEVIPTPASMVSMISGLVLIAGMRRRVRTRRI